MLFTSITFISFFLPLVIIGYVVVPARFKNFFLFCASLVFYIWGEKWYVILMMSTIAVNYGCSHLIDKGYRKFGLITAVVFSLGSLFYFKYADFACTNVIELFTALGLGSSWLSIPKVILPLGISFYTFQVISYTIDVYRKDVHVSRSFLNFATYVTLFPHLIAGPIVRYGDIEGQLTQKILTRKRVADGIERFILGLAKKVFIANTCAVVADRIFEMNSDYYSVGAAWVGAIAYSLQIYFDFSAYSDMAIGLARILGFDFHENFKYPYTSNSMKDFWRRWHISLSSWFRDYLYIPLGGNRGSQFRTYTNLLIVFFATGLWHGASWNFIFWGLWHGMFLIIERVGFEGTLKKAWSPIKYIYTLLVVVVGWVFFRAADFATAIAMLERMFFINTDTTNVVYYANAFFTVKNVTIVVFALLFCFPVFLPVRQRIEALSIRYNGVVVFYYAFLLLLLVGVITMLSAGTYNPFIYFRF